jgi:hypothetical protein
MSPGTRYLAAGLLVAAALGGPGLGGALTSHGEAGVEARVALTFADPAIEESSGLVVRPGRLYTVNDSGGGPHLFEVDLRTGRTLGVTRFAEEDPADAEALAAGADGTVWVGDIGDNRRVRPTVRLFRVRPADGGGSLAAPTFDLAYPDGPHDAEALLVQPGTGRVLVVTKQLLGGGVVYRAPRRLVPGQVHRLERIGRVPGVVTGGTFLAGGQRLLLRTYGSLGVYTYPELEPVAETVLPHQQQGEAVAVAPGGRVYLSSEGAHTPVLVVDVPTSEPAASARPSTASAGPSSAAPAAPPAGPDLEPGQPASYDPEPWFGLGFWPVAGIAAAAGALLVVLRAAVRRTRRSR